MAEEFETNSSVHGYHVYQDNWTCVVGEQLIQEREEGNPRDCYAVAIKKSKPHAMQYFNGFLFVYKTRWCHFLCADWMVKIFQRSSTKWNRDTLQVPLCR